MARARFVPPGLIVGVLVGTLVSFHAVSARAADDPPAASAATQIRNEPDFWFGRPRGYVGVRSGWIFQRAGSDLFDFVQRHLTIDDGAFDTPGVSGEIGVAVTPRVDVIAGIEFGRSRLASQYREFVDNNLREIEQRTTLREANISGSVKIALLPRGHTISRLAYVPRQVVPFVGAGAGAMNYQFQQVGSFVDFVDRSVFDEVFTSTGWTPSAHVFGGVDVQLYRRLFLTAEGRYTWAAGTLGSDFIDFDPIDLAGFRLSGGINLVF